MYNLPSELIRVIQNGTKWSEESRKHQVDVSEILRFALDDTALLFFYRLFYH